MPSEIVSGTSFFRLNMNSILHDLTIYFYRSTFVAPRAGTLRHFSALTELDDDLSNWPRQKQNILVNVCPQGNKMLIERLSKIVRLKK